jgi:glycerol-3-phosphate acyltransferase PlsY
MNEWLAVGAGLAAMLGHNFSPFLGFKGGKGVATSLGVLLGVAPKVGVAGFVLWTVLVAVTGFVSVASIAAAISLTPFSLYFYPGAHSVLAFVLVAAVVSIVKHRANIGRLLNGTESNFRRPHRNDQDSDDPERERAAPIDEHGEDAE